MLEQSFNQNQGQPQQQGNQQPQNQEFQGWKSGQDGNSSYYQQQRPQQPQQRFRQQPKNKIGRKAFNSTTGKNKFVEFLTKKWWAALLIFIAVVSAGFALWYFVFNEDVVVPNYDNISVVITAPTSSPLGSPAEWSIQVFNNEDVDIQNAELQVYFDKNFKYNQTTLGSPSQPQGNVYKFDTIKAGDNKLIRLEGVLTGNIDESTLISSKVFYTPQPLLHQPNSRFFIESNKAETKITTPEIDVNLIPSESTIIDGSEFSVVVKFRNLSDREINDLKIQMSYPDDNYFEYISSELRLSKLHESVTTPDSGNNIWFIDSLPKSKEQTLDVLGKISGASGIQQEFIFEISVRDKSGKWQVLAQRSKSIDIAPQPISLETYIDNKSVVKVFSPGEELTFVIKYRNQSTNTLKDVEVNASMYDPAGILDWDTLQFEDANVGNVYQKRITWRGSGATQLLQINPREEGVIRYTIQVKDSDKFLTPTLSQTSYVLQPLADIVLKGQDPVEVKGVDIYRGRGDLEFQQSVSLNQGASTDDYRVYDVTWNIRTRQNSLSNVKIISGTNLPPESWSSSTIQPSVYADKFVYNSSTGKIEFDLGSVESYIGITKPIITVSFRLTVLPQSGTYDDIVILKESTATAIDDFTNDRYEKEEKSIEIKQ